jgi:hypothetical protein
VQNGAAAAHLEVDGGLPDVERPEEPGWEDAAVQVVQLRPRTGVEQVDSDEPERTPMDGAVHDVLALEGSEVGFEVVRLAVAAGRRTDVERDRATP